MINWKVRLANPTFWMTIIPSLLIIVQMFASMFGFVIDVSTLQGQIMTIVDAIFSIVAACGVVIDHTTIGVGDSERALTYEEPH